MTVVILDGAMGTLLERLGAPAPAPLWSAASVRDRPDLVAAVHAAYANAGATVHTAATFRTAPRSAGAASAALTRRAVALARGAVPGGHRVAGCIAPVEDCWSPHLSPPDAEGTHAAFARLLADSGCDLLLAETFTHVEEACAATRAAVSTGLPVWVALSPGFDGSCLSPEALARGALRVAAHGAERVLVNCLPVGAAGRWVEALAATGLAWGVYANAGQAGDPHSTGTPGAEVRYAEAAAGWVARGASVVGGCCGTSPAHIRALTDRIGARNP